MHRPVLFVLLAVAAFSAFAAEPLRVVSAGPVGEVTDRSQANEIRVTFSEPMTAVGKVPKDFTPPWFRISPAVAGTFRWSGSTTLIFTPKDQLPFARKYDVTIDQTATSAAGNRLEKNYQFSFTTPTIRLLWASWYRKGGKADGGIVIGLRFNQPVDAAAVLPQLQMRTQAREFDQPELPEAALPYLNKMEPQAVQAFEAKRGRAAALAAEEGKTVFSFVPMEWDKEKIEAAPSVIVLETKPGIPAGTSIKVTINPTTKAGGPQIATPQEYVVELNPVLFVNRMECTSGCDPEARNAISFRAPGGLSYENVRKAVKVWDVTDPAKHVLLKVQDVERDYDYPASDYGLDELGYSLAPSRKYLVRVDPTLTGDDGQQLGYTWMAIVENWHKSAFISFGDGQGVWESSGGPLLPFYARNYKTVKQWLKPLSVNEVIPTINALRANGFRADLPKGQGADRKLSPSGDKIQSYGIDISPATGGTGRGLALVAVQPGEPIAKSNAYDPSARQTVVQVTNLGISAKDSPLNTLIFVTTVDTGTPVAGANVSIRTVANSVVWTGTTNAEGIAIAPNTALRRPKPVVPENGGEPYEEWWRALNDFHFIIVAEKDGDVAYVGSDWNEGITPWDFETEFNIQEADPLLRGKVFTDRGVYKLGEEVHFKAVVRTDTPAGMKLLPPGSAVNVRIRDSQDRELDSRTVKVNDWSSAEWTWKVPADAPLGDYSIYIAAAGQRLSLYGSFLVAAYRRPDFRVDVSLDGPSTLAGSQLTGKITGRYLFGGTMGGRPLTWSYTKAPLFGVPAKILARWPAERYTFLGYDENRTTETISSSDGKLNAKGELSLKLDTDKNAGWPYEYRLEGEVEDISRQRIANRTSFRVDPAPFYLGVKTPPYFAEAKAGVDTEIIAAGLDGLAVPGVDVKVEVRRIQWVSSRQAEGGGFYEWESERKEIPVETRTVTTGADPVAVSIPLKEGGEYRLVASATDKNGRSTSTSTWFYALGAGYTAWERFDHNRIELVPEKKNYKPGETARIIVKSPWERATAVLTTEREGVRTWKQFELSSSQQTLSVPITENDIPNVYVSVLLVKGRTKKDPDADGSDPGKPAFRLGYVELKVEDATKRLKVNVKANRDEFRPASKAMIEVNVRDAAGKAAQSEVTLWAVDYGVLSLTNYQTPDVLDSIYLDKALQVVNEDSRQRIISRRVLTPKGVTDGGGGGRDPGPGALRKDFRVLAFWLGSLVTDAKGNAKTEIALPESLTTYRVMAVAGDKASRFGWGQNEIRINKPLMVSPAFPRFMAVGDKAFFGAVVHNQTKKNGAVSVTIRSLDPAVLDFAAGQSSVNLNAAASGEVRFDAVAKSAGNARIQVRVSGVGENDAFEEIIPVRVLVTPETTAAYGEAKPKATETLEVPEGVVPGFGGMRLELASTAMVGLSEGARYLVDYPYGCAEQRASGALALLLSGNLGEAFNLPGIDPKNAKQVTQATINELPKYQCGTGGFSYWPGDCLTVSPYLTSWVLHVMQTAKKLGYSVDAAVMDQAYGYLETNLGEKRPTNEAYMPAYTAWQAFSVKVLAQGGRNVDSHVNRLIGYSDKMPVFALAHLSDALLAAKDKSTRGAELQRRMLNSILPEGGTAHVGELNDPYLLWFWNSNVRSTAIVLGALVRRGENEELVKRMVRWMMQVRKGGRWGNTQENAWAMESLVDYYRKYEAEVPDFNAVVTVGTETVVKEQFRGRSTVAKTSDTPIGDVLAKAPAGTKLPIVFDRQGTGTLFYLMRLRYAVEASRLGALDQGFKVSREYRIQGSNAPVTSFGPGDLVEVTLTIRNTKERRFVAVTDPLPAGTEPVDSWFATTAQTIGENNANAVTASSWFGWWSRGGFDHVEKHDDRVNVFATRLGEGTHRFTYLVRATTAGTFITAPTHAEEMYEPEVFGRTASSVIEVKR